jgi:hypothetical protein
MQLQDLASTNSDETFDLGSFNGTPFFGDPLAFEALFGEELEKHASTEAVQEHAAEF